MEITSDAMEATLTYGLMVKAGKGASAKDVEIYTEQINRDAQQVSRGIQNKITAEGLKCAVSQKGSMWIITVGGAKPRVATADAEAVPPQINVQVTANSSDLPATINALTAFFSNWRAVAGVVAIGVAAVASYLVITIVPQA